jgi:aminopeptidase-like protein
MRPALDGVTSHLAGALALDALLKGPLPEMMPLMRQLWPICRSITGPGVRETLDILGTWVPLERYSTPSGAQVYDWVVPPEWSIRDAFVIGPGGEKVIDFRQNNLHVVQYSEPVDVELDLDDLQERLHSIPEQPDAIPYVTSFYKRTWGFALTERQRRALKPGRYRCVIDSALDPAGRLDFAHAALAHGRQQVLFSTYVCHPSMANNELSGQVVQIALLRMLRDITTRHTYRGAFTTETIGTLCFLSRFAETLTDVIGGCVISCVGDDGPFTFIRSRIGSSPSDRVFAHVLRYATGGKTVDVRPWHPVGTDERQYCSPGFNLPMGSLSRSRSGEYAEYHSSLDNLDFVTESGLQGSLLFLLRVCQAFEMNLYPVRTNPYGEPQLGRRGLYSTDRTSAASRTVERLFILGYADGAHDMLDIADAAGVPVWTLLDALHSLVDADLVTLAERPSPIDPTYAFSQ